MIDRDIVKRFHKVIGFGWMVRVKPSQKKHKVQWQWGTGKRVEVREFIRLLKPLLGKRRQQQIRRVERTIDQYEES